MINFLTWIPDCEAHNPVLLDLFISSDASICFTMVFPQMGNSGHVVSVSTDFLSNSKREALFHGTTYDYFCDNWDSLCNYLRDVSW